MCLPAAQTLTSGFQWAGSGILGSPIQTPIGQTSIGQFSTLLPTIDRLPKSKTNDGSAHSYKQRSKHRFRPANRWRAQRCCDRLLFNLSKMEYLGSEEHETECSRAIKLAFQATEIDDPTIKRNLFQTPQKGYRPIVQLTVTNDQYPSIVSAPSNYFEQGLLESDRLYFVRHPGGKMRAPDSLLFYHSKKDDRFRILYFEYKSNIKRNDTITCGNTNPCPDHIYVVNKRVFWSGDVYIGAGDVKKFEKMRNFVKRHNEELRRFGLPSIRPGSRRFSPNVKDTVNTFELQNRITTFLSAFS